MMSASVRIARPPRSPPSIGRVGYVLDARVPRQPDGDDRQAADTRVQAGEILDRAVQHGSIVEPGAQHDLGVDLDPQTLQPLELRQDRRSVSIVEQLAPDVDVGRVDRR